MTARNIKAVPNEKTEAQAQEENSTPQGEPQEESSTPQEEPQEENGAPVPEENSAPRDIKAVPSGETEAPAPEKENSTSPKRKQHTPDDALDIEKLWLDPALGDGITDTHWHSVRVGKPKGFFRTVPDKAYRRRVEIYSHKSEGQFEEQPFIIAPEMKGRIPEARPCTIVTYVYRDGTPGLWVIKFPREGEKDNEAWLTARSAAKIGIEKWVALVWTGRAYLTRDSHPGYAPEPDFKLPSFNDLVRLGFGAGAVVRDINHPIYRELYGIPQPTDKDDDDL